MALGRPRRAAAALVLVLAVIRSCRVAGRSTLTQPLGQLHLELDKRASHHVKHHANGLAAVQWLSQTESIIPAPVLDEWAHNLVVGYAAGYSFETLKPLVYSFLGNTEEPAQLVLLTTSDKIEGLPATLSKRVVVQKHEMPTHLSAEDLPYAVSLRFFITVAFLKAIRHSGNVFFLDTRDVFIQRDPFKTYSDGILHFPQESSSYRLKGPYTDNHLWLRNCYGEETMYAIGGMYVLNSGTLIGPTIMLVQYFELMLDEFQERWHCMRLHGADQVIHNYLIYTGKLISTGLKFQIEDQVAGQLAFVAYTHPAVWDFRYVDERREELFNREGVAIVAIHLWPGDNRVAKKVILPFVEEMEERLGSAGSEQRNLTIADAAR